MTTSNRSANMKEKISFLKEKMNNSKIGEEIVINDYIHVGKNLINIIAGGTYKELPHIFREYVSNALDSESKSLDIQIYKPNYDPTLAFHDEGEGMDEERLAKALQLGLGNKSHNDDQIGELGIGLYAGGNICEKIRIQTKMKGMNYRLVVDLPVRSWIEDSLKDESDQIYVNEITDFKIKKELDNEDEHYTDVHLVNLNEATLKILQSEEDTNEFLRKFGSILPIEFPDDWHLYEQIREYTKDFIKPKYYINVFYNGKQIYRPVPKILRNHKISRIETRDVKVNYKGKEEILGKIWVVKNPTLRRLGEEKKGNKQDIFLEGVAIRLKNVEIISREDIGTYIQKNSIRKSTFFGDCYLIPPKTKLFKQHIEIIPQTNRADIRSSPGWNLVKDSIVEVLEELCGGVKDKSALKSKKKKEQENEETEKALDFYTEGIRLFEKNDFQSATAKMEKAIKIYKKFSTRRRSDIKKCREYIDVKIPKAKKAKQEAELKAKQEAELKAKQEAELKAKQEAELKAKQEAELKAKQETELKAKQETELKAKQEAELKAKQETELKAKQEAELKAKQEAELKAKQEAELKAKQEAELKAKQEAELKAKQEAELKAKQEAELKAKQEAELKAKQEAELKAKQEAELKAKQETELKAKQETELKAKQETELKAKQETELKAKQEAVRKNCVLKSENYHFQKLFCDKNEKNCNELIAYLIESDVHGVLGKLSDFIRWDEIEEKYFQTIRIIKNFIPYRIVVENKEILIRIEDLADIPKFHPIGICSLDSYELINQDLPKLEGIINWAYNLIPLSSQKILPLLQFYLSDLIVVDSKKARDQLRNSSKYNVVSLTGEFLSKTGDIIVGKKNWVDLNEF